MLMEMLLTALAAVFLSFLIAKLVSAVIGGGDVRERAAAVVVEGGGAVGEKVERVAVVDRFGGVDERCRSEMLTAVVYGFGKDLERVGGGDEEVESAAVEEEVECRDYAEISENGVKEVKEIGGVMEEGGRSGVELGDEKKNAARSCMYEVVRRADGGRIDEMFEDKEGGEVQAMDVENADSCRDEMEKELRDEVAERIGECIRNMEGGVVEEDGTVNDGCKHQFGETAEPKVVADSICGLIIRENSMNDVYKNEFEETEAPKDVPGGIGRVIHEVVCVNEFEGAAELIDVPDRIDEVNEEDNSVTVGHKNEVEETEGPKDANLELKDQITEERFRSSKEDDDWEGIEMSELYSDFKSAAAFVRKEDKDGKFSNSGSELKMQLYGLQKIVMEGPCREAQPMAIKMSARAKWNAWQRLGNMNPEDAMKQYIALVSGLNPENAGLDAQSHNIESTNLGISDPDQSKPQNESQKKKDLTCNAENIDIGSPSLKFKD